MFKGFTDKKKLFFYALHGVFFMFIFSLFGCCPPVVMRDIPNGKLSTEECVIEAVDGSFQILSGVQFKPPYQNPLYKQQQRWGFLYLPTYIFKDVKLVNGADIALNAGARPVKVKTPYIDQELYGILFLGQAYDCKGIGPAGRSYLIKIPEYYVENAMDGKISVYYEKQTVPCWFHEKELPTWILWLSDQRFW